MRLGNRSQSRRIVVPDVNAFIYRALRDPGEIGQNKGTVTNVGFLPVGGMEKQQHRIKGIEHEQTALFGGVLDLNIGHDVGSTPFDSVLPDDIVEVFYRDIAEEGSIVEGAIEKVLGIDFPDALFNKKRTTSVRGEIPKFTGPLWKSEIIEKPSQATTKINAWDFHRMMQYMNIPRGVGAVTPVTYISINPFLPIRHTNVRRSRINVQPNNDLLDYIDHAVLLFLNHGHEEDSVFMEPAGRVPSIQNRGRVNLNVDRKQTFGLQFYELSENNSIKEENIRKDYAAVRELNVNVQSADDPEQHLDHLDSVVSKFQLLTVTRFMDAMIQISNDWDANDPPNPQGDYYRVMAELVVVDQYVLARLLVGALTYDHGLNEWFTPVVNFDPEFLSNISNTIGDVTSIVTGTDRKSARLSYVRVSAVKVSEETLKEIVPDYRGFQPDVSKISMRRIAIFNTDSWGQFKDFFGKGININLQTVSTQDIRRGIDRGFARDPSFLPAAFASVPFPQKKTLRDLSSHTFYKHRAGGVPFASILEALSMGGEVDISGSPGETFRNYMRYQQKNITSWVNFMHGAFSLDDKLVSFMTSIPTTYMRADIYTGSKFKTFSYDSISIIRAVQILASCMGGFPSTNNPTFSGSAKQEVGTQERVVKVNHYPIFLANRVVVQARVLFCPAAFEKSSGVYEKTYRGYWSITEAVQKFDNSGVSGKMFLILDVGFKKQVFEKKHVDFDIPLRDINDLGMVKGSAINHMVNLSLGEYGQFYEDIVRSQTLQTTMNTESQINLSYNIGGRHTRSVAPAEFNSLTIADLTQNDQYDPIYNRSSVNTHVDVEDGAGYPPYDARMAYLTHDGVSIDKWDKGLVAGDRETRRSKLFDKAALEAGQADTLKGSLVSVKTYCDFSDLIKELDMMDRMANATVYTDLEDTEKALYDNIKIVTPFRIAKDVESGLLFLGRDRNQNKEVSLTEFVREEAKLFREYDQDDMLWDAPLSGEVFTARGTSADFRMEDREYTDDKTTTFLPFMGLFAVITYVDLIVKGVRYLLWTISKSRFLSHMYLPMNYEGYTNVAWEPGQRRERRLGLQELNPGSSIIVSSDRGENVRLKSVDASLLPPFFKRLGQTVERLIQGQDQHQLSAIDTGRGADDTLIWYVSKKIVYIGEDVGAMMRLLLTEGSFDWTIFYREDTQMTRLSEYFLTQGMGNFFLRAQGE